MSTLKISHLPLRLFGFDNVPAVPVQLEGMLETLVRLGIRAQETQQAQQSLTTTYTIGNTTAIGHEFLFGKAPSTAAADARNRFAGALKTNPALVLTSLYEVVHHPPATVATALDPGAPTALSLDQPEQWSISWTRFPEVYQNALPRLPEWASSLTDADAASAQFWPTIATYGLAYNLLVLQKVDAAQITGLKSTFQGVWTGELDAAFAAGKLYAIDMSLFETVEPQIVDGFSRFTPATITLLIQDARTKALTPVAVRVAGAQGAGAQVYSRANARNAAWLYALQAAKASVTVYGVWLGHVYHWHIVTAALQMTMYNNVPSDHPIYQLLSPQSNYCIPFDDVLLLLWKEIAPPTSIGSAVQFLQLINTFAADRNFFDDDPTATLANLGLDEADFTVETPWDRYPIVAHFLRLWGATGDYIQAFVDATYPNDQAVAGDSALQAWMAASGDRDEGNVRGLPPMTSKEALTRVLTSLLYRVTVHGTARLSRTANPALTFVANFPPCLQSTTIPEPTSDFDTKTLLAFLPKTGTIGQMVTFYFTFSFSVPYQPFIPIGGVETSLFFPNGLIDPRNQALIRYRNAILDFITEYEPEQLQRFQWPLNIET